ncbi:LVIS_2131 family protein [uncultured Lactobacillus sp.]|uniref:LVIS_2131 family protein n=1 Tax=uncultured Lactobacillus sp. TaxID=153152 RepID=UPI002608AA96|nr:LVIS_2131 family protein [uncultured Lactobacillus sp.]
MWSWNVLGVALWVGAIVYLVFIVQNIRRRRLKMIIQRQHKFEWGNSIISLLEVVSFCLLTGWLLAISLFDDPNLTDTSRITSSVTCKPLVLQPSASQSYYVQVKSSKNRDLSQQYIFYLKGKKYTVPSHLATVSYSKDPINVTASALPFSRKELKKEDSRYQQAYVAIYTAKYKNTAANGQGLHAGREAKRFYLIRVPDSSFIDKENK